MKNKLMLVLLYGIFSLMGCQHETDDIDITACHMAISFFKERAKNHDIPNRNLIEFGNCNKEKVVNMGNGNFQIINFFDAVSMDGAKRRFFLKIALKYEGGPPEKMSNWYIVDMESLEK